ncbi:MAG: HAMP domain-containing sensor histidine kinase [Methanoregula sp.]|nr:HAMP domain-containing sensor histidine kinase [Methanoregula sp.]
MKEIIARQKKHWQWITSPVWSAFLLAVVLAAILLPYWWLAVQWSFRYFFDPGLRFTFITTTFLVVLIIADCVFLVRYYQIVRGREFEENVRELRQTRDALRSANKKLTLLSGITRHDIRNQLMALQAFIQLSEDSVDKPAQLAEFFLKEKKIADTIERQINFTGDYEDMGGRSPLWQNVEAVVLRASAGHILGEIRIELNVADLHIFADPLLEKVFFNLIDNALRYGRPKMTMIRISSAESENGLVIFVEDDGTGIYREDKKQIFERGFGKNTGLGLFLSREILSITGITIAESGEPGTGARFEFLVPKGGYRFTES